MSTDKETTGHKSIMDAYAANKDNAEHPVVLFANHHLEELDAESLKSATGESRPDPETLLSKLVLLDSWDDDETGDVNMDFTLPHDVTHYLLCVKTDKSGKLVSIDMES